MGCPPATERGRLGSPDMSELPTTRTQLDLVLTQLTELLGGIEEDQLELPTPCTEFDVAALRRHVIGWLTAFADGYASAGGECSDPDAVEVTGNGVAQTLAAARVLRDASEAVIQRGVSVGPDRVPSGLVLPMLLWEYQVHGWDLAVATGQPWQPEKAGVAASLAFVPGVLSAEMVGEGKSFAPAVPSPDQASPMEQLVALSGRDPGWQPKA